MFKLIRHLLTTIPGAFFNKTSFVVAVCATIALILGAFSVGATQFLTRGAQTEVAATNAVPAATAGQVQGVSTPEAPTAPAATESETDADQSTTGAQLIITKEKLGVALQAPLLPDDGLELSAPNPLGPVIQTVQNTASTIRNFWPW